MEKRKNRTLMRAFQCMAVMLMVITGLLMSNSSVRASEGRYYASIGSLTQTELATNTATITWELDYESSRNTIKTAGYNIYIGEDYQNCTFAGKVNATSYRFTGLADGKQYYVKVEPYGEDGTVGNYSRGTFCC